jgi:tetratricopeptide (TPR) repeat protein
MAIKGELPSTDLSSVFQMLSLNRQRARLFVREQGNPLSHRRLYVQEDRVALDERPAPRPLGPLLVEMGIVSYADYRLAAERGHRYQLDTVHFLRQTGKVTEDDLARVNEKVLEESILEVFLWKNVFFNLQEGGADPACDHFFSVDHLIMEAARRQDEWRHHFDQGNSRPRVFVRTRPDPRRQARPELEPLQNIVLDVVDGIRGSHQMTSVTGLSRYHIETALSHLHRLGLVVPLSQEQLIATGDKLQMEGRVEDAIRLFRCALPENRADEQIHRRLGEAYLKLGRVAKGAAHLRFQATLLFEQGRHADVLAVHREILHALPTEFQTLEWAISILADLGGKADGDGGLLEQADALLALYIETDQGEAGLRLAENLLRIRREDSSLLATVAKLRLRTGRQEEACEAYADLAAQRTEAGDLVGALEIYRTIIGLAPAKRELYVGIASRLQEQLMGERQQRQRTRIVAIAVASVVIVVLLSVGYGLLARRALDAILARPSTEGDAAREVIAALQEFRDRWPLTPAAVRAAAASKALEARLRASQLEAERARDLQEQRRRAVDGAARSALAEARGLLSLHRTVQARDRAREALRLARESGMDPALLQEIEMLVAGLDHRIFGAEELLARSREARRTGDRALVFATASVLARQFRELAAPEDLVLPVRITAGPGRPRIEVRGANGSREGVESMDLEIGPGPALEVTVTPAAGETLSFTLRWPPERHETVLVLPGEAALVPVSVPVRALVDLGRERVALVGRNGAISVLDSALREESWPQGALRTIRGAIGHDEDRFLTIEEGGAVHGHSASDRRERWTQSLGFSPRLWASRGPVFAATDGKRSLVVLDTDSGRIRFNTQLPANGEALAVTLGDVGCRLASGDFHLLDAQTGLGGTAHASPGAVVFPHGPDQWLQWTGEDGLRPLHPEGPALGWPPGVGAPTQAANLGSTLVLLAGEALVLASPRPGRTIPLPARGAGLVPSRGTQIGVLLEGGGLVVLDTASGRILAATRDSAAASVVITGSRLILAGEAGPLRVHSLQW